LVSYLRSVPEQFILLCVEIALGGGSFSHVDMVFLGGNMMSDL